MADLEREIKKIYREAEKDLTKKWRDYMQQADKRIAGKEAALAEAKKAGDAEKIKQLEKELADAKRNETLTNEYYQNMVKETTRQIAEANQTAQAYTNDQLPSYYTQVFNTEMEAEAVKVGVRYDLADEATVRRLIKSGDIKLKRWDNIDVAKDRRWNTKFINAQVTQGIIQGESMDKIADRLFPEIMAKSDTKGLTPEEYGKLVERNQQAAIRNARTLVNGAENRGRQDRYQDLENKGCVMKKIWISTIDDRVREWHAEMDGQEVGIDEMFIDGHDNELEFPCDPNAEAETIYNCRCSMRAEIVSYNPENAQTEEPEMAQAYATDELSEETQEAIEEYTMGTEPEPVERPSVDKQIKGVSKKGEARSEWLEDTLGIDKEEAHETLDAVERYTMSGTKYSDIHNGAESAQKDIETLDAMLQNPEMPIYDGTIYRGVHIDDSDGLTAKEKVDAIVSGGTWNEPGITSFSNRRDKASQFAGGGADGDRSKGVNCLIVCKDNKTGCPIQHLTDQRPEGEVLVPSNIKDRGYTIKNVKYKEETYTTKEWDKDETGHWYISKETPQKAQWVIIEVEENDY